MSSDEPGAAVAGRAPRSLGGFEMADRLDLLDGAAQPRRRRAYLRECAVIAAAYLAGGACLALFALAGAVPASAPLMLVLSGWSVTACAAWVIARGRTAGWRDPSAAPAQSTSAMALFLLGMVLYPRINLMFCLFMVTALMGATYRVPMRLTLCAWATVSLLMAAATIGLGQPLQVPMDTPLQRLASWLCLVTVLMRCIVLSLTTTSRTLALRDHGRRMAATLREIERLASHDELTGVLNRRAIHQVLHDEVARTERSGTPLGLVMIDLDHFKRLNDTWGHPAGDRALQLFAQTLRACARATDRVGRHGGEEFLLVLIDTDEARAGQAVERARAELRRIDWHDLTPGRDLTFSAGVACHRAGETVEQLFARADRALYEAKHAGRDRTCFA